MLEILGKSYITEKEASARYGLSVSWFKKRRLEKAIPHVKLNGSRRVYYSIDDSDKWFDENLKTICESRINNKF